MLLHRYTIDQLANAINSQIAGAAPDSRLTYRFYRKGRRDGRRRRPTSAVMGFVQNAVELAMSKIAEQHLATELDLSVAEHVAESGLATVNERASNLKEIPSTDSSKLAPSVTRLLEVRRARQMATLDAEKSALDARHAEVQERSSRMKDVTMQRMESCQQTGHLIWARYLTGFDLGFAKRGVPDDEAPGHNTEIEFTLPETFKNVFEGKD